MNFDMRKPCGGGCKCPFRTDCLKGWLGKARATEIAKSVFEDNETFPCHKTVEWDDTEEGYDKNTTQMCAGAEIMVERLEIPNAMLQIAERIGLRNYKRLDMGSPVFDSVESFISHHT